MFPSLHTIRGRFPQRRAFRSVRHAHGQALVELALTVTFLAYLFAAAVDLGLAYKAYQTLLNSTAEASTYLEINKLAASCSDCSLTKKIEVADSVARTRFRSEQGNQMGGFANTMDLNADGKDDELTVPSGYANFEAFMRDKVKIDEADASQIDADGGDFTGGSFNPNLTDAMCQIREEIGANNQRCYIVIRSQIDYKPFALAPVLGDTMTINAISVKQIVN